MSIQPRSAWNARNPKSPPSTVTWSQRTGFMVHHSAGPAGQSIRAIQDHHMDGNGWNDIGYNLVITPDGSIYEARGALVVGAHAENHNTPNIGVLIVGFYGTTLPTKAALDSAKWLYREMNRRAGKTLAVLTHKDVNNTACPGNALHAWAHSELSSGGGNPPPVNRPPTNPPANWYQGIIMSLPQISRSNNSTAATRKLQSLLAANGHPPANTFNASGRPDGVWGDGTDNALASFQEAKKVRNSVVNGKGDKIAGEHTWRALL